ncbi:CoA transferase family III [Novosphingobium sp. PhB57]|uniref:CoA transferase n=1 Tax=Novosphingobium sp. PhB57 TaxID=2485107 RepID=UPI00104AB348|nr:CoA transferase [Novosphingobium sp. PhB57]TCU54577.1 CoA transferase family III [Novosphingobium sp. PhB57]
MIASEIQQALGTSIAADIIGDVSFASCYAVSDLLSASIGAVGSAASALLSSLGLAPSPPAVRVDRRLALLWSSRSVHPIGWELPPVWDIVAGDYRARDGWIKLHTNLPHHRRAALKVLGVGPDRANVASAVARWDAEALETAIVLEGGVAAMMRSRAQWTSHPQGIAIASEPLVSWRAEASASIDSWHGTQARPLAGLRVLDLTRVIAGPVATRTLAGLGATVLRIDPPLWEEPNIVPDVTLGKCCANLRLDTSEGLHALKDLLASAHVLVHGYRPGALDGLGLGASVRRQLNPSLVEVALDAYGWTGPWSQRRGFDSLVQMSSGIAEAGMTWRGRAEPTPLPVQALDHATGYLMAAAALVGLDRAIQGQEIASARLSLARTGDLLTRHPAVAQGNLGLQPDDADFFPAIEHTVWGDARRLRSPLDIGGTRLAWTTPAVELGTSIARWPMEGGPS